MAGQIYNKNKQFNDHDTLTFSFLMCYKPSAEFIAGLCLSPVSATAAFVGCIATGTNLSWNQQSGERGENCTVTPYSAALRKL